MVPDDPKRSPSRGPELGSPPRVRATIQRAEAGASRSIPSTLPPPLFVSEVHVQGLEWWLDSHVEFASELLCLRQMLDGAPESGEADRSVRRMATVLEQARDALYELYCDAPDPRLAELLRPARELEQHVRASYAWCSLTLDAISAYTDLMRERTEVHRDAIARVFQQLAPGPMPAMAPVLSAIRSLNINFCSPIEPLRNLERDLEVLYSSLVELSVLIDAWEAPSVSSR
ncbi:MAG: hypothetical protein ABTD50_07025 [Polyangiaceae bacterium]